MAGGKDFLVELGTEELPPKALKALMTAFTDGITQGLEDARLEHGAIRSFASPRRLAVIVEALADSQADREVMQKGPPVKVAFDDAGEPTRAALAFAQKCGVDIDDLGREKTDAGEWLVYAATESGQPAAALLPDIVSRSLENLPIPRRMRWGDRDTEFVRPVHWLIMLHGDSVVPGQVLGLEAGKETTGHRFHCDGTLAVATPDAYETVLEKDGYVIADFAKRRARIVAAVTEAASAAGGTALDDDDLFDEVTALTEWPVPLTGAFDAEFLSLPDEVIVATLTAHQRYFPVRGKDGQLLPVFITLANLESREPERVRDGNERVIRPRLADARFFWDSDRQTPLGDRTEALKKVVYQQGLGSLHDKSMRVAALARMLAEQISADPEIATRAAVLAKCDLLTGMVGEFPELQGTMGAYYADDEADGVAQAIGEQYLPRFAGDLLPASPAGQILSVADKLDTLAGVFSLGKKPSGNRDPFGLRRAALGVIRIVVEGAAETAALDIDLYEAIMAAVVQQPSAGADRGATREELYDFIVDRFRGYVLDREQQVTADMFEAVRSQRPASLADFLSRLYAIVEFLKLDSAASLAAANKRTANILRKAGDEANAAELDVALLADDAERVLYHAMQAAEKDVSPMLDARAYSDSLKRLAELRVPVDAFFDGVMVMSDDDAVRNNRLALLAELRSLFLGVADISRLTPGQD